MLALEWNLDDAKQAWFEDGVEQGIEQGIKQGEIRRAEKMAVKMILKGRPFDEIHELTDLSLQRIQELANNNLGS